MRRTRRLLLLLTALLCLLPCMVAADTLQEKTFAYIRRELLKKR